MAVAREALTGESSCDLSGDRKFEWRIHPTDGGDPGELRVQPPPQSSAAAFATGAASGLAQATDPHHIACIPGSCALILGNTHFRKIPAQCSHILLQHTYKKEQEYVFGRIRII